jgi:hypothetical protein
LKSPLQRLEIERTIIVLSIKHYKAEMPSTGEMTPHLKAANFSWFFKINFGFRAFTRLQSSDFNLKGILFKFTFFSFHAIKIQLSLNQSSFHDSISRVAFIFPFIEEKNPEE